MSAKFHWEWGRISTPDGPLEHKISLYCISPMKIIFVSANRTDTGIILQNRSSSESSLFAKVPVMGFAVYEGLK